MLFYQESRDTTKCTVTQLCQFCEKTPSLDVVRCLMNGSARWSCFLSVLPIFKRTSFSFSQKV